MCQPFVIAANVKSNFPAEEAVVLTVSSPTISYTHWCTTEHLVLLILQTIVTQAHVQRKKACLSLQDKVNR